MFNCDIWAFGGNIAVWVIMIAPALLIIFHGEDI